MRARRLSALLVILALAAGNIAVCAGWAPTPEARMACCSEGGPCPMHHADSSDASSRGSVTQADADSCCAVSERHTATPSVASAFILPASLATLIGRRWLDAPVATTDRDAWRRLLPVPGTHLPTHLLLSILVV